jgi:glycerophosphoryl diester phosphodiesterase
LEAFAAAAEIERIAGIELDIQLTKDNEMVVIHDETVTRTTNGTKAVQEYTLSEIQKLKITGRHGSYSKIPTLEEVFQLLAPYCFLNHLFINVELKNSKIRYYGMEEKVIELVKEFNIGKNIIYSSFLPESLSYLKKIDPKVKTGVLAGSIKKCIKIATTVKADALHPKNTGLDETLPETMKNMPIRMWNVFEPFFGNEKNWQNEDLRKYKPFGVTDIITNIPEYYLSQKK